MIEITQGSHKIACSVELGGLQISEANKAKVQFTVRRAGEYRISVLVDMIPIKGSPFIKTFLPGKLSLECSVVPFEKIKRIIIF